MFASSIAKIEEYGPSPPDMETRGDKIRPVPGTGSPQELRLTLHSGETLQVQGPAAARLRQWLDWLEVAREKY